MVLFDLLQMTKTKILVLVLLMVFMLPSYFNFYCTNGVCAEADAACIRQSTCGFFPLEFLVTFIWMYVLSCLIIEIALFLRKKIRRAE